MILKSYLNKKIRMEAFILFTTLAIGGFIAICGILIYDYRKAKQKK